MDEQFSRTRLLLGEDTLQDLSKTHIAVFGVGGVGGYVIEALVRCGVGKLTLIDNDIVSISNLNRQIIALHSTIGRRKTEVMRERILDINPAAIVACKDCFYLPENADQIPMNQFDYVVDAVDTITAKLEIIVRAQTAGVPVISSMGTGNKIDPSKFVVTDIYQTSVCPLAKVMRKELKKKGIEHLKVVYSTEFPMNVSVEKEALKGVPNQTNQPLDDFDVTTLKPEEHVRRSTPGSISYAPAIAGLMIAGEVINDLIKRGQ